MAAYIQRDSDPEIPPPYSFPGVTIQSFRLRSNISQQQSLCDRYLNIGPLDARGFYYQAVVPFVDLDYVNYPMMISGNASTGFMTQNELYFRIYLVKFVSVLDSIFLPVPAIIGFLPYIYVDNVWSLIAGREVSGFPKLLASFQFPAAQPNPPLKAYPIQASTLAFETLGPGVQPQVVNFITIAANQAAVPNRNVWALADQDLVGLNPAVAEAFTSFLATDPGLLRTVQLKEFRDPDSPMDASYQAIVEGQFSATNFQLLNPAPAQININSYVTLSIAANLGLNPMMPLLPISQYAGTCDLTYSQEETLFVND